MHTPLLATPVTSTHVTRAVFTSGALCAALLGIGSAFGQTHPLPNVGSVNHCASQIPAFAGGHGDQSCAVATPGFLASKLRSDFLRNKCPTGQALRGLLNNSCTDARNVHPPHSMSSNFRVTLCCGYAPPAPASSQSHGAHQPVYEATGSASAFALEPPGHRNHFKVANVPLKLGVSRASGCPQIGVTYRHAAMPQTIFFRGLERRIDQECADRGSPYGYSSLRLHSCSETVDPKHPPQVHFHASADIFCAR